MTGKKHNSYTLTAAYVLVVGVVFWLAETVFFGMNPKPLTMCERICDAVSGVMIEYGLLTLWDPFLLNKKNSTRENSKSNR